MDGPANGRTDGTQQAHPKLLPLPGNTPERLPIVCNGRHAELVVRTQQVLFKDTSISASDFEKLCGRGKASKWKQSCRTVSAAGHPGEQLHDWLSDRNLEQEQLDRLAENFYREVEGKSLKDAKSKGRRRSKKHGSLTRQHETEGQERATVSGDNREGLHEGWPSAGRSEEVRRQTDEPQPQQEADLALQSWVQAAADWPQSLPEAACMPQHRGQADGPRSLPEATCMPKVEAADGPQSLPEATGMPQHRGEAADGLPVLPEATLAPQFWGQAAADGPQSLPEAACTPQYWGQAAMNGQGIGPADGEGWKSSGLAGEAEGQAAAQEEAAQGEQGEQAYGAGSEDEDTAIYAAARERLQQELLQQQPQEQEQEQHQQEHEPPRPPPPPPPQQQQQQQEAPSTAAEIDRIGADWLLEFMTKEERDKKLYFSSAELKHKHLIQARPTHGCSSTATVPIQVIIDGLEFPTRGMEVHYDGIHKERFFFITMSDLVHHLSEDIGKLQAASDGQGRIRSLIQTLVSPGILVCRRPGFPNYSSERKCYVVEKSSGTQKRARAEPDTCASGMGHHSSERPSKARLLSDRRTSQAHSVGSDKEEPRAIPLDTDIHKARLQASIKRLEEQYMAKCNEAKASLDSKEAARSDANQKLMEAQQQLAASKQQLEDVKSALLDAEKRVRAAMGHSASSSLLFREMVDMHNEVISCLGSNAEGCLLPRQIEQQQAKVEEEQRRVQECEAEAAAAQAYFEKVLDLQAPVL